MFFPIKRRSPLSLGVTFFAVALASASISSLGCDAVSDGPDRPTSDLGTPALPDAGEENYWDGATPDGLEDGPLSPNDANANADASADAVVDSAPPGPLDKTANRWEPAEWKVVKTSNIAAPFDLVATVTFTHQGSGEIRRTGMFFAGSKTWSWRFTGTQTGVWNFVSESADSELNGLQVYVGKVVRTRAA
jgi:hypothetical protein